MSLPKVLLTNPIHPELQAKLAAHCDVIIAKDVLPQTLCEAAKDVDAIIVRAQLPKDIFEYALKVRAVVRHGVGLDMIPVEEATKRQIPVANLPGSNTASVVEYCVSALLHFRRRITVMDGLLRQEGWAHARALADYGKEISGSVCGIVGVGSIGSGMAKAASGLGMGVLGLTRRPETLPAYVKPVNKESLFRDSDAVILCCPLTQETRGLVDAQAISLMKPSSILINVSRGPVVDTQAVIEALRSNRLAGAALDVHDQQPLKGTEPVFDCQNLLLTPHVAAITESSMYAMSKGSVDSVLALLRGERIANVVNPEVFHENR